MTTKDEALRLALEALESTTIVVEGEYGCDDPLAIECSVAITAIREALAQPAGERGEFQKTHLMLEAENAGFVTLEGYVHSLKTKLATALLSADAQPSEWVGLSDAEWMNIVNKNQAWFGVRPEEVAHEVCKLTEEKLREKNAGNLFEDSLFFHEVKNSSNKLAPWLSAALEDPNSCSEFKAAIEWWFQSGITDKKHWPEAGKPADLSNKN